MNAEQINELAIRIHEQNVAVGWWDDPDRCLVECLQLTVTEVAEATEAARKDLMDDHLPHRKGEEVELADAMIRLLDLAGSQGWEYVEGSNIYPHLLKDLSVGALHFEITGALAKLHRELDTAIADCAYSDVVDAIQAVASARGHDLWAAVEEKSAYNRQRADHKRENRAKSGGKKF